MFAVPPEALLPWKRAFVGFVLVIAPQHRDFWASPALRGVDAESLSHR